MDVTVIDHLDPDQFGLWYGVYAAANLSDHPTYPLDTEMQVAGYAQSQLDIQEKRFWAVVDGNDWMAVGMDVRPLTDNLETVFANISVHPDARRRGLGRRLVETIRDDAAPGGRRRMIGESPVMPGDNHASARFTEALGFRMVLGNHVRALESPIDRPGPWLEDMQERSASYEIITWRDATPDWAIDGRCELDSRMVTDAPMGDMTIEAERYDPARVREDERMIGRMGMEGWCAGAAKDGKLVAYTVIVVPVGTAEGEPDHAFQFNTIVHPDHRGHRLGLAIKWANHRAITESGRSIGTLWTHNAIDNEPMAKVNELFGFEIRGQVEEYQLDW